MIEFERTIGASEVNSGYLNLSDDRGRSFGADLDLEHRAKLVVKDEQGRTTSAQKHHANQLWGTLKNWYADNDIQSGTRIQVRFDSQERHDGLPVVHLIPEGAPQPQLSELQPAEESRESQQYASEIPIRLERQLEDFLAANPGLIEPGLTLYHDEDGRPGRQYPTDVGVVDLLCRRPSGEYLVIELKRSHASDAVVGQISRYIGWVKKHIAGESPVSGLVLCHERDESLKYAIFAHQNLALRYFKIRLELVEEDEL